MNKKSKKIRNVKEYDERKSEITDIAAEMFMRKGYEKCSVNEIIGTVGIAKGTFYYYFKTKEEVLDAVIYKFTSKIMKKAEEIVKNSSLTPQEKLLEIFFSMNIEQITGNQILSNLHKPENVLMHQKSLISSISSLTPLLTAVVEEGIEKGVFSCPYPKQYMQIFLSSVITLTDEEMFDIRTDERQELFRGMISLLEKILSAEEGEFLKRIKKYGTVS
ncbi:MAG: TetR/AcrR family transcriptional regulator [Leptotrichiaceae bacterium]|nr:TetR/AcrR family transcriptional regulator [Leptotrichiaceae bacterium]